MPFDDLNFCYPWRPSQARVLAVIEDHLEDDRLHVVAAPIEELHNQRKAA
jgi:hypothetical protein